MERSYKDHDEDLFKEEFLDLDWENFENTNNPEQLWDIYENNIRSVLDPMCPIKHFKIARDRDPWISDDLINEIKHKDQLLRTAKELNWLQIGKLHIKLKTDV